jgi:acyl-coenzyme A synthetase/AMP-(fatty) acid ligase
VKQAANALLELGVKAGDRVAIYLPMIPEAVVAMLACARIGAPHTVVFRRLLLRCAVLASDRLRRSDRDHG